jgi:ABC-type multidrug transport system fused ATPase/permease subunit
VASRQQVSLHKYPGSGLETRIRSLERIQDYVSIEQEPKSSVEGEPPAYWPASGDIRVEHLSAKYSVGGPKVLHDLSFHVKSGEHIGVGKVLVSSFYFPFSLSFAVGRTGSGKVRERHSLSVYEI